MLSRSAVFWNKPPNIFYTYPPSSSVETPGLNKAPIPGLNPPWPTFCHVICTRDRPRITFIPGVYTSTSWISQDQNGNLPDWISFCEGERTLFLFQSESLVERAVIVPPLGSLLRLSMSPSLRFVFPDDIDLDLFATKGAPPLPVHPERSAGYTGGSRDHPGGS